MKNLLKFLKFVVPIFVTFMFGAFSAQVMGAPEYGIIAGSALVSAGFLLQLDPGVLAETITSNNNPDISALTAYAGKFQRKLFTVMRNGLDIISETFVLPGIKHKENLGNLTISDGIESYKEDFNLNAGDVKYGAKTIEVELLKRDLRMNPLKYRTTWMAEAMKPGVNVNDIPYARFFWDTLLQSIGAEINDNAYYAVKSDGLTFAKSVNGFAKIIADAITAGGLVPVATGAITNQNAVAAVESVAKSMTAPLRKKGFSVKLSYDVWDKYQEDYREKYGKYLRRNDNGDYSIDSLGPKVKLEPATWMGTSQRIIAAPKEELITGVDAVGDMDKILIDTKFELMDIRLLFALGFQINQLQNVRVNDQDLLEEEEEG